MSKKITEAMLKGLVEQMMVNEIDIETFKDTFDPNFVKKISGDRTPSDPDEFVEPIAKNDGDATNLTVDDIKFYETNLDKIVPSIESRLLTLRNYGDPAAVQKYEKFLDDRKNALSGQYGNDLKGFEALVTDRANAKADLEALETEKASADAAYNASNEEYTEALEYYNSIKITQISDLPWFSNTTVNKPVVPVTKDVQWRHFDSGLRKINNFLKDAETKFGSTDPNTVAYKQMKQEWESRRPTQAELDAIEVAKTEMESKKTVRDRDLDEKKKASKKVTDFESNNVTKAPSKSKFIADKYPDKGRARIKRENEQHRSNLNKYITNSNAIKSFDKKKSEMQANQTELQDLGTAAAKVLELFYKNIEKTAKKDQTAFGKSFTTAKGDYGVFDPEDVALISRTFASTDNSKTRIQKFSEISKKFAKAASSTKSEDKLTGDASELLRNIQLMDLIASVVKNYDSGAGAYVFEYFLALICGGSVAGKEKTSAGKMGVADFIYKIGNTEKYGSAKFVQKGIATQAVSGFEDLYRTNFPNGGGTLEIEYVITAKKSVVADLTPPQTVNEDTSTTTGVSSDPSKIIGLLVWVATVTYDGTDFKYGSDTLEVSDGTVKFKVSDFGAPEEIYLARHRTETFKEMLEDAIVAKNSQFRDVFLAFRDYLEVLELASDSARLYTIEKDDQKQKKAGNAVYKGLTAADNLFDKVVAGMEYGHDVTTSGSGEKTLNESKKVTPNLLKKLISENFKK